MEQSLIRERGARAATGRRPAVICAGVVVALASGFVLLTLVCALLNHRPPVRLVAEWIVSQAAASLAFAAVGGLIVAHRPAHRIGWLCSAIGVGGGALGWVSQYTRYALVTAPGTVPGGSLAAWLNMWAFLPYLVAVVVVLPLTFPDGRLPSPRWRLVAGTAALGALLLTVGAATTPGAVDASLPEVTNPLGHATIARLLYAGVQRLGPLTLVLCVVGLGGALAAPVVRFRRGTPSARRQITWFALATALLVIAVLTPLVLYGRAFIAHTLLSGVLLTVTLPFLPAAVGIAVLRYHLWDLDLVLNRALVYAGMTAVVVGLYVGVVGYLGALFREGNTPLSALAATGVVAVLVQPLHARLQRGVNRLLYGDRDEPYAVLARLDRRLEATLEPEAVLPAIVTTVAEALRTPYAALTLRGEEGADSQIVAAVGTPVAAALRLPLSYQGEVIGHLLVAPRRGAEWAPADLRLLREVAQHAGPAAHGVLVMAALRRSRERLVLAREEERRRLRANLHDDLAPTLAALGLQASTVGELVSLDPARASASAAALATALRGAVGDVRRLVYDLRPPALDELGLVEAIRERAAVLSHATSPSRSPSRDGSEEARLHVTVEAPDTLPPLPAAVESAAYRIVQEALMNVAKHAHAQHCAIRIAYSAQGPLAVEVADDGVGLPELGSGEARPGVGLRSMRERAAELGGDVRHHAGRAGRDARVRPVAVTRDRAALGRWGGLAPWRRARRRLGPTTRPAP